MNRIFKQLGYGYSKTPVSIIAKINNTVAFSGEIPTVDEALPVMPQLGVSVGVDLFSWDLDATFNGTLQLEIEVTGGTLLLTATQAQLQPVTDPLMYGDIFVEMINGSLHSDPLTDVQINGQPYTITTGPELTGQVYRVLPDKSVFSATIRINQFDPLALQQSPERFAKWFKVNTPITPEFPVTLVAGSRGVSPYAITVAPELPDGISINSDLQLFGTPTTATPVSRYTFTVTDYLGNVATDSYSIAVLPEYPK